MKPIVYLCGPIFNTTIEEAWDWRTQIKEEFNKTKFVDPVDWKDNVVATDMHAISKCDAVLANLWKPSYGSAMEVFHSFKTGKYVSIAAPLPVSPWLVAHSHNHSLDHFRAMHDIIQWFARF